MEPKENENNNQTPIEGVNQEELGTDAAAEAAKKAEASGAEPTPPEGGGEAPAAGAEGDLSKENQETVDDAAAQHEKNGTWPEGTPEWVKKTVNRATRQKYEFKTKAETLEVEIKQLKEDLAKKDVKTLGERPKLDDFDSEEDFHLALSDWNYDKRRGEELTQNQENTNKSQQETAQREHEAKIDTMFDKGADKFNNFAAVVTSVPGDLFRQEVISAIVEADNSADVAHFLASNLQEAEKISNMNGTQRAIAIGQISLRLATPTPKTPSKTPEPITPGGGNNNGAVDDSKLTDDEWFAKRQAS